MKDVSLDIIHIFQTDFNNLPKMISIVFILKKKKKKKKKEEKAKV